MQGRDSTPRVYKRILTCTHDTPIHMALHIIQTHTHTKHTLQTQHTCTHIHTTYTQVCTCAHACTHLHTLSRPASCLLLSDFCLPYQPRYTGIKAVCYFVFVNFEDQTQVMRFAWQAKHFCLLSQLSDASYIFFYLELRLLASFTR